MVKNLPAVQETWVWSLDQEDPLQKEMEATIFYIKSSLLPSILAWEIPWTKEPGGLQDTSCVRLFATPWTVAHQAPLSTEFSD